MYQENFPKQYYRFLDGFRAYAILWVILHHINIFFDLEPVFGRFFIHVYMLAEVGYLGVDIFFVISGFLITGLLVVDLDKQVRLKRFYLRRFFKIVPQYLLAIISGLLIMHFMKPILFPFRQLIGYEQGTAFWAHQSISSHGNMSSFYSYFIFIQNYVNQIPILAHTWSIAIEEHFYLIYPLILSIICKYQRKVHLRVPTLIFFLLILIFGGNFFRYFFLKSASTIPIFQKTQFRIDALMFGCLLRLLEPYLLKIKSSFWKIVSPFCCLSGLTIFAIFVLDGFDHASWSGYTLAYLAAGLLLVSGLTGFRGIRFFTENRFLVWIGKNSYGTYLWHYIIIFLFAGYGTFLGNVPGIILYLISALLMGYLTTVTIERYALHVRNNVAP